MPIPERIPIARFENYYTENIGTYDGGKQFMAFVVAGMDPEIVLEDWARAKRWYAILHKFDEDGRHIETLDWYAGVTADGENSVVEAARVKMFDYLKSLEPVQFKDVAIKLFQVEIDGVIFGLQECVDEDGLNQDELVQLLPNDFIFYHPWDGNFDT